MYTILLGFIIVILIISTIVFLQKFIIGKTTIQTKSDGIVVLTKSKEQIDPQSQSFSLFKRGEQKQITNTLKGKGANLNKWHTYNYEYFSKDDNAKHQFTIAKTTITDIPDIIVNYKQSYHKVGDIFGFKNLSYENKPELSNNFTIQTKDDITTFKLFSEELLTYLQTEIKGNIEIESGKIIYYENNHTDIKKLITKLDNFITLLNN